MLVACGSRLPEDTGGFIAAPPDWEQLPGSAAQGPACSFYPCVDICGKRIAVAPVEPAFGFEEAGSLPGLLRRGDPLRGNRLLTVNGLAAEILDAADFALLGRIPLASAYQSAAIEDIALVQGSGASLSVLDVAGPTPSARSWWFDTTDGYPTLRLIGAAAGHFLIHANGGIALVDVADGVPREVFCLQPPAGREWWDSVLTEETLALAEAEIGQEPESARLFRITSGGVVERGTVSTEREGPIGGAGGRISVTWRGEQHLDVFDVSGDTAVEVASIEGGYGQSDTPPAGGFEFFGAFTSDQKAVDLRDSFEVYDAEPIAEAPCLFRLESRSSSEAFIVSPLWPDARLPAEPVPSVTCPERSQGDWVQQGMLSPDGSTLLYTNEGTDTWVLRDLASGSERPGPTLPRQALVYWGPDRFVLMSTEGGDFGLVTATTLTVVSASAPYPLLATFSMPGPVLGWRATATDLWALSYSSNFEYGERPPATRYLLRIDPNVGAPEATIIRRLSSSARQLAVSGDRAYVLSGNELEVVTRDGTTLQNLALPTGAYSIAASELGFFMSEGGRVSWLAPGQSALTLISDDCNGCRVQGADATRLYTTAHAPRDARHPAERNNDAALGYTELRAYDPEGGALIGRYPLPTSPTELLIGDGRVVVLGGPVNVLAPPPPP
jgi:hypothetical protein